MPWQEGEKLAAAASGPVVRCFIEDGNHVANNRVYRYRPQSGDWMARHRLGERCLALGTEAAALPLRAFLADEQRGFPLGSDVARQRGRRSSALRSTSNAAWIA